MPASVVTGGTPSHVDPTGRSIHLVHLDLPPSENHVWVHRRQGGQVYSTEAENFKKAFITGVGDEFLPEIQRFARGHTPHCVYYVRMTFYFSPWDVLNRGWFEWTRKGERKAQTPYKRMDVGNRRKLLEDCITAILGIDDNLNFRLELVKQIDPEFQRVEIEMYEADPREYGIPDHLFQRMK